MRQALIEVLALVVLFLVVFLSILYAFFTGYWRDVAVAHIIAIGILLLDLFERNRTGRV